MVRLTKLNGKVIWVNADLVESVEETPDTIVGLTTGKRLIVTEPLTEVVEQIIHYQQRIRQVLEPAGRCSRTQGQPETAKGV